MEKMEKMTLPKLWENTVSRFAEGNAFATVGEQPVSYREANQKIGSVVAFLEQCGVVKGSRVAILSANMPHWAIAYFAITQMGAVAVPLLPDFSVIEIETFLSHSGAEVLLVSENLKYKLKGIKTPAVKCMVNIEDFSLATESAGIIFDPISLPKINYRVEENDLASIIYTSGTTGKSKGVMLTHKNIVFDAVHSGEIQEINQNDRFLSVLPLSHVYENTIGLVLPVLKGASVYYLSKPPIPSVLLPALQLVKPTIMLSVPLIIEKIYRNRVLAGIRSKIITRLLYHLPFMRKKFHKIAGKKLMDTFGGELKFFGIGGAKLDRTVEKFLREARFPYAIGYGLTETAPLVAGVNPLHTRLQSTGPVMQGVQVKINEPDHRTGEGEIWVKGENVMKGYYKEPELTQQAFSEDGWFKTGDLGIFDEDRFLYIKGRLKNMIVGSNGENIYPEEIESVINNFRYVVESLVVQKKGKLVAMVHFDREELERRYQHLKDEVAHFVEARMEDLINELQVYINARVSKNSRVQLVIVHPEPFQKTATQKIKRYKYM
jgi:long-chain acyl-CoA synthetase